MLLAVLQLTAKTTIKTTIMFAGSCYEALQRSYSEPTKKRVLVVEEKATHTYMIIYICICICIRPIERNSNVAVATLWFGRASCCQAEAAPRFRCDFEACRWKQQVPLRAPLKRI